MKIEYANGTPESIDRVVTMTAAEFTNLWSIIAIAATGQPLEGRWLEKTKTINKAIDDAMRAAPTT